MPKQSPIITLKKLAEHQVPGIVVPDGVRNLRAFYEGVIACGQTKTCHNLTKNPYTKGSDHFQDWNTGWLTSEVLVIQSIKRRKETFTFLKEAV